MAEYDQVVAEIANLLAPGGYALEETGARIQFTSPMFGSPILAIPDTHLADGSGGDIFYAGNDDKPRRLLAVMQAIYDYQVQHPMSSRALQLGDWFDIWRVCGSDPTNLAYGAIQDAPIYADILRLDALLGLSHLIGNHDAGFLNSLPDRRAQQPRSFRLGFWVGSNVYAMHGHQTDIAPPVGAHFDEVAVAAGTALARYVPGVVSFEAYVDRLGLAEGVAGWLLSAFGTLRDDPGPQPRPADGSPLPANVRAASFVVRENVDALATVARKVELLPESQGRRADVILVGHSHQPGVAFTTVTGRPVFVVDGGAWVYSQSNLLVAAGGTISVLTVAPR